MVGDGGDGGWVKVMVAVGGGLLVRLMVCDDGDDGDSGCSDDGSDGDGWRGRWLIVVAAVTV